MYELRPWNTSSDIKGTKMRGVLMLHRVKPPVACPPQGQN